MLLKCCNQYASKFGKLSHRTEKVGFHPNPKEMLKVLVAQLCLTLSDPMNCNLPGSSVLGILQTRVLVWAAIPFSRDLPNPGIKPESHALWVVSLPTEPSGKCNPKEEKCQRMFKLPHKCTHFIGQQGNSQNLSS